jgi:PadR family transcriptional regulator PadR
MKNQIVIGGMRTSDYKTIILKMFRRGEFYGYDVHKRLQEEGLDIELSRLYRILNEMDEENLLESRWEKSYLGPRKKMYRIGDTGKKELNIILLEAVKTVHDFYGDYLLSLYPEVRVFDAIFDWFTESLKGDERVGYLINSNSGMHETVIWSLKRRVPQGMVYIFSSENLTRDLNIESAPPLRGGYDNIPLKNGFLDLMMIIDLPPQENLEMSLAELKRVLSVEGRLGVIVPSILLTRKQDPLTIGDFIEVHEHETIEQGEHLEKERLIKLLKSYFQSVKEIEIVHLTLLQASKPMKL